MTPLKTAMSYVAAVAKGGKSVLDRLMIFLYINP